ncbi:MAG: nucleoside triphosphate pyrophosphohydrolase [candidate division Zixibacteria bacterium]|nr:nucleoside triphosphate pyrophosphohydrolase [candidate division Zixibacteria bacterium]
MSDLKAQVLDPSLTPFEQLCRLMAVLRSPEGCQWDRAQTHRSLLPYLIEEAYEVLEAVEAEDYPGLKEELGDLLCQIVFHTQLAQERGEFDINDSVRSIIDKLIRRHPHVFKNRAELDPDQVRDQWEKIKTELEEKKSVLSGLPRSMPALTMAYRIGEKAAGVGFDWGKSSDAFDKVIEELDEVREVLVSSDENRKARLGDEIGDLLFAVASVARLEGVDPEAALRRALAKFRQRFERMEAKLTSDGRRFDDYTLDEMEAVWQRIKRQPEN